jgi:hypothetical protein
MPLSSKLYPSVCFLLSIVLLAGGHARAAGPTYAIGDWKLEASDTIANPGGLGYSLALADGDLVAGSYKYIRGHNGGYVFSRSDYGRKAYIETGRLSNANAGTFSNYGYTVAGQGNLAAVGAPTQEVKGTPVNAYNGGVVHLYERSGATWNQVAEINASDAKYDDQFGSSIAMDGNQMVIGSRTALYVFERNAAGTWIEKKRLVPTTPRSTAGFGSVVSISGDLIAAGAGQYDSPNQPAGSVFLFEKNAGGAGNWGQTKTLVAPDGPSDNRFGAKLDLDGDRLAVAALRADTNLNPTGAVHIFERNQGGAGAWGAVAKVTSGTGRFDQFGRGVDLKGDLLVVGAPYEFRAYAFDRAGSGAGGWVRSQTLAPGDEGRDIQTGYGFGSAVLIGEETIFVGAPGDPSSGLNNGGGAIYTFNRTRDIPVFGKLPEPATRESGQTMTFSAPATGPGPLLYQWRFNGEDLAGKTAAALELTNLNQGQSGFYTAVVRNAFGSVETPPAYLTVAPVPGIPALTVPRPTSGSQMGEQYTVGFSFTASESLQITHLGCLDITPDGYSYPVEIGLWNRQTGQLLVRSVIKPTGTSLLLSGAHRYVPITPISLQPGTPYVVGVFSIFTFPVKTDTSGLQVGPAIQVQGALMSRDVNIKMPQDPTTSAVGRSAPSFLFSRTGVAKMEVANGSAVESPLLHGRGGELIDLGAAAIHTPTVARTLLIRNRGDAPLHLSQPLLPPGVELAEPLPAMVAPGGSTPLRLRLNSSVAGSFGGEVIFASNVAHLSPFSFSVQGTVMIPEVAIETIEPDGVVEDGIAVLRFRVSRTGPINSPLRVLLAGTGTALPAEYSLSGATLEEVMIPGGGSSAEWSVLPVEDRIEEQDESVVFEIREDASYIPSATRRRAEATILNDDYSPVAVEGPEREVPENGRLEVGRANGVLAGASDRDDDPEGLTAELSSNVLHGSLELRPDGSFLYQPQIGYHGPDEFFFRASDGANLSGVTRVRLLVIQQVDLQLRVAESSDPFLAGLNEPVWHRYTLVNGGPSTATGIEIAVSWNLPEPVSAGSVLPSRGEFDGSVWRLASLAPGESAELLLPFTIPTETAGSSSIVNSSARVTSVAEPLILPNDDDAQTATSILSPASMSFLGVEAAPVLNRQNGLLKHRITVLNANPAAVGPFRLVITGLPEGVIPQGASGMTAEGQPYFLIGEPLAAGGQLELTIEFFSPGRSVSFVPQYRIELLRATPPQPSLSGQRLSIERCTPLPDGSFMIEWPSAAGARYAVEYSGDLTDWVQAGEPVTAAANRTQWVDNGPPKTVSPPASAAVRYYRVVILE